MLRTLARQAVASSSVIRQAALSILPAMAKMTSSAPVSIKASPEEVRNGKLSERNLEMAVRHMRQDGLVVVENAIDHKVLDKLNEKMVQDAILLRSRGDDSPFNYNKGNLQQDAPPVREYFDPSIFLSKVVYNVGCDHSLTDGRSTRNTYHIHRSWTSTKADVYVWKYRYASVRQYASTKAASSCRCRLPTSIISFCSSGECRVD